jgi:Fe2+ transport system protein FeoA
MQTDRTTLLDARRNYTGTIVSLPEDDELRSQCIRLGLCNGANFVCVERLPGGTIVLETNRQEIALGRSLAGSIGVVLA